MPVMRCCSGVGCDLVAAGAGFGAGLGAAAAAPPSEITATIAPTGATSPSTTRISASVPAAIDGTSIDTLSVSISNRLSPGFTAVPGPTNHFVILPSATVSPSCGIRTSIDSLNPFPGDFLFRVRRPQDQPVADELVGADEIALVARLQARRAVMRHRAGLLVDGVGAEVGDVVGDRDLRLVRRHHRAGLLALDVGRDLHRHLAVRAVVDDALRIVAARLRLAVDRCADVAPRADDLLRGIVLRGGDAHSERCHSGGEQHRWPEAHALPAHRDVLRLQELLQSLVRALAADAGLLHAAE